MKNVIKKAKIKKNIFNMVILSKKNIPWNIVLLFLTILVFTVYSVTSGGHTAYDYFTRLAEAFLHGKYYLDQNLPWLNELVPIGVDKYAVVYPPAPAIIAIPFVAIFKSSFYQDYLSWSLGAISAYVWGLLVFKKSKNKLISLWIFLLTAFGNIVWFMSSTGSVWYLGQVAAYFFLTLSIYESSNRKRLWLLGIWFGLAVLSRLQVILAFPLIFYLVREQLMNWRLSLVFFTEAAIIGFLYGLYNYLRFGSFLATGYTLIPGVLQEPWFEKGLFNFSYFPDNLRVMFNSYPKILKDWPYVQPSLGGLAVWITSPVFIYAFWNSLKKLENWTAWVSIILIAGVVMSHGTTGFTQFGYRFAVDFYPIIIYLITNSVISTGLKWHHWLLLLISITVNAWGVILINNLGFASY